MQDDPKKSHLADGNWLIEMLAEDSVSLDHYLDDENAELQESSRRFRLPKVIGILPIRNAVAYPGTVTPLAIGRDSSKALLAETKPNKSVIGLVTQRNSEIDKPGFDDIYEVGAAATILKVIKLPQGSIHVVVHSIARFKILKPISTKP